MLLATQLRYRTYGGDTRIYEVLISFIRHKYTLTQKGGCVFFRNTTETLHALVKVLQRYKSGLIFDTSALQMGCALGSLNCGYFSTDTLDGWQRLYRLANGFLSSKEALQNFSTKILPTAIELDGLQKGDERARLLDTFGLWLIERNNRTVTCNRLNALHRLRTLDERRYETKSFLSPIQKRTFLYRNLIRWRPTTEYRIKSPLHAAYLATLFLTAHVPFYGEMLSTSLWQYIVHVHEQLL